MDNIGTDQNGRDGPVKIVLDKQGVLRSRVSLVRADLQAVPGYRRKRRFRDSKIHCCKQQQDHDEPGYSTAVVHRD